VAVVNFLNIPVDALATLLVLGLYVTLPVDYGDILRNQRGPLLVLARGLKIRVLIYLRNGSREREEREGH
jgi:hypothetical protein